MVENTIRHEILSPATGGHKAVEDSLLREFHSAYFTIASRFGDLGSVDERRKTN